MAIILGDPIIRKRCSKKVSGRTGASNRPGSEQSDLDIYTVSSAMFGPKFPADTDPGTVQLFEKDIGFLGLISRYISWSDYFLDKQRVDLQFYTRI